MSGRELLLIATRDSRQVQITHRRYCRDTPEHITQLLGQSLTMQIATLVQVLADVREDFARFLSDAGRGVEEFLLLVQSRVQRPRGCLLVFVDVHGAGRLQ